MLYNCIYNTLIRSHHKLSNENSYTDKHTIAVLLQAAHFVQPLKCQQVWIEMSIDLFHIVRYCFLNNALSLYGSYDCT